jgi:Regulator of G protein signaling domain
MAWNSTADWRAGLEEAGLLEEFMAQDPPGDLNAALADGNWEAMLHRFAVSEYSPENLDFLRAVGVYQYETNLDRAQQIFAYFIGNGAAAQINLGAATKASLVRKFGAGGTYVAAAGINGQGIAVRPSPSLFDGAKQDILNMVEADTWRRFRTRAIEVKRELNQ